MFKFIVSITSRKVLFRELEEKVVIWDTPVFVKTSGAIC